MTESIYERLDLEVKRLSGLAASERRSESFVVGVEHAANIAFRMGDQFRGVPEVTAAILAAWPDQIDSTESVLIRVALRVVATELRIDLDTALAEAGRTAVGGAGVGSIHGRCETFHDLMPQLQNDDHCKCGDGAACQVYPQRSAPTLDKQVVHVNASRFTALIASGVDTREFDKGLVALGIDLVVNEEGS